VSFWIRSGSRRIRSAAYRSDVLFYHSAFAGLLLLFPAGVPPRSTGKPSRQPNAGGNDFLCRRRRAPGGCADKARSTNAAFLFARSSTITSLAQKGGGMLFCAVRLGDYVDIGTQ
jgi:hypothetical protein